MSRNLKGILSGVMIVALALMLVLALHYGSLSRQLADTNRQLLESRNTWEQTAAEKETLQKELSGLKDALKEARLTLSESQERAETLKEEIATLEQEIQALKDQATPAASPAP